MPHGMRSARPLSLLVPLCIAVALLAPSVAGADPTPAECDARVNDTPGTLIPCIQKDDLWAHMQAFQDIANANPGLDGHPSRNSGEPGYKASVDYVADKMKAAGYDVTIQPYKFTYTSFVGTPTWSETSPTARLHPGHRLEPRDEQRGGRRRHSAGRRHRPPADADLHFDERLHRGRLR
jgi:hypothetical protein